MSAKKPSQEERTWAGKKAMALVWTAVSCSPPLPGRAVTVPSGCEGLPAERGGRLSVHGWPSWFPCILARVCSALPRWPRLPACSDTTARVPSCPPCAVGRRSRLNEPCPRLTSPWPCRCGLCCAGAPLSVRQQQRHRGMHRPWVRPWHHTGRGTAQALRGLPRGSRA